MDSNKLKAIVIVVLALFAALYLGISAATAQLETIAWVLAGVGLSICIFLGRKIWLLIPLLGAIDLTLRIPGQPNTLLLAQVLVIGFSVLLLSIRKLKFHLRFTEVELYMVLFALLAMQAYLRNPVGLNIFGGSSVGGKFYFTFAVTLVASTIMSGLLVDPKELWTALKLSVFGGLINLFINIVGIFVPIVGFWASVTVVGDGDPSEPVDRGRAGRIPGLSVFSNNLALWISSFKNPMTAVFHPIWLPFILVSMVAAGLSGFRTAVILTGLIYLICIFYRGRMIQVIISVSCFGLALALMAVVNTLTPLPPNIQRSLTFLPGTWEQRYKDDAQGSTDWRVEMWEEALTSDRWIQNKVLGDGLGFTTQELNHQLSLRTGAGGRIGISGFDVDREGVLASGGYHSVFVSSVRTCGYVGAVIFIFAMLRASVRAHRLIVRSRNTEWFPLTLFFGVPIIVSTFWFPFNTLTYLQAVSVFLYQVSMLRMLENNLPLARAAAPAQPPFAQPRLEHVRENPAR
ncbi:MAG: hypothetical protein EOP85_02850 [Verrucomicrobiaceae bacterium]|nr:MAG: hypothetical protein EOP85_02850 [Verrucomicrobiaceae bacterium]